MNSDKPLGAGLIAFGIAGIIVTMQISVKTFNDDPGPKLFPIFAFAILILAGAGMLLTRLPAPSRKKPPADEARVELVRGTLMAALLVGYAAALWLVGYYLATPLAVYAFYHVIAGPGRRVLWRGALYAALVTGSIHLVFVTFLHTFMPQGILF